MPSILWLFVQRRPRRPCSHPVGPVSGADQLVRYPVPNLLHSVDDVLDHIGSCI
jgi:hypothetical protein